MATKEEMKAQAEEQESVLLARLLNKQQDMLKNHGECNFLRVGKRQCEMAHIEEMVKLAHKIRSLLNKSVVE